MKNLRLLLSILLIAVFAGGTAFAKKVPQSQALQVADAFFKSSGHFQQNMAVLKTSEDLPSLATKGVGTDPKFYVIGNQSGKGFVIVSADDRFRQVLGYSFEHNFINGEIPTNMEHWFLFLREQMEWAERNNITDPVATSEWMKEFKAGKPVKELETALWNQGTPYNNQCPMDKSSRSLTGCVATAVGEVMRFHSWPVRGNGIISGYTCSSGVKVSTRNLNHDYDWDNMPLKQSEINSDAKREAISTLLADIGAALHLNYSKDGTGGIAAQPALVNNFGYASTAITDFRCNYSDEEWKRMLKNEINNDRPVIYDGQDEKNGGHCFVMDGYDDKDFFHFNWGWGGSSNGYYAVSALNPSGYNFDTDQDALFGFKPGNGEYKMPEHWLDLYTPGLGTNQKIFKPNTNIVIEPFIYTNSSVLDFLGNVGLFVVDKQGNTIEKVFDYEESQEKQVDFPAGKYLYSGFSKVTVKTTKEIKKGYRIRAFYKPSNSEQWFPMWRNDPNPAVTQEILIAEDIEGSLADLCSFYMDDKTATVTVPAGTTTSVLNGDVEVTEGVTKTDTSISIEIFKLNPNTRYHFHLVNGTETKDLYFKGTLKDN